MNNKLDGICESGLQFFGKMTASISHELKNVLAIINENAGLLEDLALMADKGMLLKSEKVKALAGKIMSQIQRADGIIRNTNTFAHSVDESVTRIDLSELLSLLIALSNRFASMRGVTLELKPPQGPVSIITNKFFLENLLWLCLDFVMDAGGQGKTVVLSTEEAGNGAVITVGMIEAHLGESGIMFPGKREEGLVGALKGKLTVAPETGEIILALPADISI
jgi:signal transduction histidine kinase